jgi:serine/threonine protein phosphatase 1
MTAGLTYAIGDVHGCLHKLAPLMAHCAAHAADEAFRLVFLGDYIDRGPDSAGVIAHLITLKQAMPERVVCLRGNHEALLLDALTSGDLTLWLLNGGERTLAAYGVMDPAELPAEHLDFIGALPFLHDDGLRFYVHAGVDPLRPLADQREQDLLWIREPFLSAPLDYGRLIVHGHTPQPGGEPDLRGWRLNLDTAAVFGGPLTAAAFRDAQPGPVAFLTDSGEVRPAPPAPAWRDLRRDA